MKKRETGESIEEMYKRGKKSMDYIQSIKTDKEILVVGHRIFIMVIFALHLNIPQKDFPAFFLKNHMNNAEIKEMFLI